MATEVTTATALAGTSALAADAFLLDRDTPGEFDRLTFAELVKGLNYLTPAQDVKGAGENLVQHPPRNNVVAFAGDSNTDDAAGRPGFQDAVNKELLALGGALYGWTWYNRGQNGITLKGWVDTIATGNSSTPTTTRGNAWAVKNLDPDLIISSLGTNDVNSPTNRSTIGTEANLRANLFALVSFWLINTRATILLHTPQPLVFEDFFSGPTNVTQWANADEAAEASRRIRVVHNDWKGRVSRVLVYDTHGSTASPNPFGTRIDDKATQGLDPYDGAGVLLADSLHCSNLGYRRKVEGIGRLLRPDAPHLPRNVTPSESLLKLPVWSASVYCSGRSGSVLNLQFNPQMLVGGGNLRAMNTDEFRPGPLQNQRYAELLDWCDRHQNIQEILAAAGSASVAGYSGALKFKYRASGNEYACDGLTLNQYVAASGITPGYVQATPVNISPALDAGDTAGNITFWVEDVSAMPWNNWRKVEDIVLRIPNAAVGASQRVMRPSSATGAAGVRNLHGCRYSGAGALTIDVYQSNQDDGRYVLGGDAGSPYSFPGKRIGTVTFGAGILRSPGQGASTVTFPDATNFPSGRPVPVAIGDTLRAVVVSGAVTNDCTITAQM